MKTKSFSIELRQANDKLVGCLVIPNNCRGTIIFTEDSHSGFLCVHTVVSRLARKRGFATLLVRAERTRKPTGREEGAQPSTDEIIDFLREVVFRTLPEAGPFGFFCLGNDVQQKLGLALCQERAIRASLFCNEILSQPDPSLFRRSFIVDLPRDCPGKISVMNCAIRLLSLRDLVRSSQSIAEWFESYLYEDDWLRITTKNMESVDFESSH